jgi:hypothetical protein
MILVFICLKGSVILVCNQNQVLVSGTEDKAQVRCRYLSRIFFFRNQHFQKFSASFLSFFKLKFLKAWNWTQIFKNNLNILNIW